MENIYPFIPLVIMFGLFFFLFIRPNLKYLPTSRRIKQLQKEFVTNVTEENVTEFINLLKSIPRLSNSPSTWESMRACYNLVYESKLDKKLVVELRRVMMGLGVNHLKTVQIPK
ncbi:preprotein translocase subunit YajC [Bacillus pinisoli]|uniref:preprotein translocase subunit YajC n=1 Tax=Bacillus pinisoli TaxID=2901866 RepID=UPI001FF1DF43|nr:preprotein translocase subunit YajC [Bacillus pinisoli]